MTNDTDEQESVCSLNAKRQTLLTIELILTFCLLTQWSMYHRNHISDHLISDCNYHPRVMPLD